MLLGFIAPRSSYIGDAVAVNVINNGRLVVIISRTGKYPAVNCDDVHFG